MHKGLFLTLKTVLVILQVSAHKSQSMSKEHHSLESNFCLSLMGVGNHLADIQPCFDTFSYLKLTFAVMEGTEGEKNNFDQCRNLLAVMRIIRELYWCTKTCKTA